MRGFIDRLRDKYSSIGLEFGLSANAPVFLGVSLANWSQFIAVVRLVHCDYINIFFILRCFSFFTRPAVLEPDFNLIVREVEFTTQRSHVIVCQIFHCEKFVF